MYYVLFEYRNSFRNLIIVFNFLAVVLLQYVESNEANLENCLNQMNSYLQWKHAYVGLKWLLALEHCLHFHINLHYTYKSTSAVVDLVYRCQDNTLNCPKVNICGFVLQAHLLHTVQAGCGSVPLCIQKVLLISHLHESFAWFIRHKTIVIHTFSSSLAVLFFFWGVFTFSDCEVSANRCLPWPFS